MRFPHLARVLPVIVGCLVLALGAAPLSQAVQINWAAKAVLETYHQPTSRVSPAQTALAPLAQSGDCSARWLQAFVAFESAPTTFDVWDGPLACDARYVLLLHGRFPKNEALAEKAIAYQPGSAMAWFWMGELTETADPAQSIAYYQQGLILEPKNGLHACYLGRLLRPIDRPAALEAYSTCCFNGDPGVNGCYNAGAMAEEDGDWETALQFYRASSWSVAQGLADKLESQPGVTPP